MAFGRSYGEAMRVQLVITVDLDRANALRDVARAEGLKVSELLRKIIVGYIDAAAKQSPKAKGAVK